MGARTEVVAAAVACLLLGACSSGDQTTLATAGASPSTSRPATSPSPAAASGTPAATSTTTSEALPARATMQAAPLAPSMTGDAKAAAEAYLAYWDYVTTAGSDPEGTDVAGTVGTVATGEAAARLVSQIGSWASKGVHLVGTLKVTVRTSTPGDASATACGLVDDRTVTADASGTLTQPLLPSTASQSARLTKSGPAWRVSAMKEVSAC